MRTFRIIWLGELVSLIGSGLTSFALGVWIFQKTGQATPFALTVLFANLPRILALPLSGMLADRTDRRLLMLLGDTGAALATLAIAILALLGRLDVGMIYLLVAVSSVASTFQEPAYRASVAMLVPKKDLARASGMMSAGEAAQMLVAPLLAGFLFGVVGLGGVILIDFVTYFFALGALLAVRIPQPERAAEEQARERTGLSSLARAMARDAAFAWRYLVDRPGLFWQVWYFALVNFLLNLSAVLIGPLVLSFATSGVYGLVEMVMGAGLLAGSVAIAAWGGPKRRMAGLMGFIALAGAGLGVAGLRPSAWVVGGGMLVMLFFIPWAQACSTAISQSKIEPAVQGRVFAMRGLIGQSITPLAYLLAGLLADRVFGPLLMPGGALADSWAGRALGVGPGRGVGLIFVLSGLLLVLVSGLAWSNGHIRNVEAELPDAQIPAEAPALAGVASPETV